MLRILKHYPIVTLIPLAVLCALIWSVEIDDHGWEGLGWVGYIHWAIPIGLLLFICWANLFVNLSLSRRILLNIVSMIYGVLYFFVLYFGLVYLYDTGPSAMFKYLYTPKWLLQIIFFATVFWIPFLPVGAYLILQIFKLHVRLWAIILAVLCMFLSVPVSIALLDVCHHRGYPDELNALKSGFIIPFFVCALGLLIVGIRRTDDVS